MPNLNTDVVFTRAETAACLKVHPHTVDKLISAGRLDGRKQGASTVVMVESVHAYLANLPRKAGKAARRSPSGKAVRS